LGAGPGDNAPTPYSPTRGGDHLFANALDACPDPARVTVTCRAAAVGDRPGLHVTVRDNGPGFTPDQRARALEPFFTTKATGTGLGLAISRRILEAHGGTLAVGQDDGPGGAIDLTLPRHYKSGTGPPATRAAPGLHM
jgi:signal transduction histidine kinase